MDKLLCLKASAGSGKTFSLANRYLSLLFKGAKPNEIVAITFTNKAAKEMEERIIRYLRDLENEKDFLKELSKNSSLSEEEILRRRKNILNSFLKSDIHITTIDSFIQKIARKFAPYGDFEIDFEIKKDNLDDIFTNFLQNLNKEDFDRLVNFAKQENLINFFENLYLKDKELKNVKIEDVDFDLDDGKIKSLQEEILDLIEDCTPSAKKFISQDIDKIILSDRIKTILQNQSLNYKGSVFNRCYSEELDRKFFELYKKGFEFVYKKYLLKEVNVLKTIFNFYNDYKNKKWEVKKKENYLDFKDVEHLVYKILVEDELNRDFLYFRLDSKINHILIDEFQDTSITQWKIIEPLVDEIKSGVGQNEFNTFFYVGDIKQAIYRFRGGNSSLFDYVYKKYKDKGMKQEALLTNYRSGEEIVDFVNEVFNLNEKAKNSGGYVEIKENILVEKSHIWQDNLKEVLKFLFDRGAEDRDIAILVYGNEEILRVSDFIKDNFNIPTVTSTTKKVINQPFARAVIDAMKYLYYEDRGRLYLFNFLTFIDKEFNEEFNLNIDIDRPSIMIKKLLDRYDLWNEATLKLLEYSIKYDTLLDFISDIDNCEETLLSNIKGINILTIHKSKGLEFENVIVIDKMKKNNNKGIKLLYDYDEIELKNIRYKQKNMEILDEEYKRVLEKEKELEKKDLENLEYVAYTRAKNSLFILKNEKDSNFLKLKDYKGEKKRGEFVVVKEKKDNENIEKYNLKLRFYGSQDIKKEKEYKPNDYEAIYKGVAIHSLFEMEDRDFVLNRYGVLTNIDEVKELVDRAKEYEEYIKKLNGKIYKELPFVYDGKEGIMDLMIETDDEIIIIDYKTKKPEDESGYIKQVKFYKDAMKNIKNKKIKGYLFYIEEMELKEI